jgi:serine protease Do
MRKRLFAGLLTAAVSAGLVSLAHADAPKAEPAKPEVKKTEVPKVEVKPFLGVAVEATSKDAAHAGALVRDVTPDSPAAKAGLKKDDVIVKVGDQETKGPEAVVKAVAAHKPGDKVTMHIFRDGKEQDVTATLGEHKVAARPESRPAPAFLGVWTQSLTGEMKEKLGVAADKGAAVMMVAPNSPAARAGLERDDVITAVNDQAVATPEELRAAVQKAGADQDVTLKVMRGKETKELKVHLDRMPLGGFGQGPRGLSPDFERHFQEMQKMLRDLEEHFPRAEE